MTKKQKSKLRKARQQKLFGILSLLILGLIGVTAGLVAGKLSERQAAPTNLVWAADETIKLPDDLKQFLETQDSCNEYRGNGTPAGVGLWGVYQVAQDRFAKIAYGCSWNLSSYIMAVKQDKQWQLLQPPEYFAPFKDGIDPNNGALPNCAVIEKYQIPATIESFCINADGMAQANAI